MLQCILLKLNQAEHHHSFMYRLKIEYFNHGDMSVSWDLTDETTPADIQFKKMFYGRKALRLI